MKTLRGNHAAMVTPMTSDFDIDYESAALLTDHLIKGGVDGILVAGVTGECFSLSDHERRTLAQRVVNQAAGRVPVGVNVSHSATRNAVELAVFAESSGATYLLLAPPTAFANPRATLEQIAAVADSTSLPVMVYDGAEGITIPVAVYEAILDRCKTVAYSKVNVADPEKVKVLREQFGDRLGCFAGRDDHCIISLAYGAIGFVCAISNLLPGQVSDVYSAHVEGVHEEARRRFYLHVAPVLVPIFASRQYFIQSLKFGLQWCGVIRSAAARPSLTVPPQEHVDEIRGALALAGVLQRKGAS